MTINKTLAIGNYVKVDSQSKPIEQLNSVSGVTSNSYAIGDNEDVIYNAWRDAEAYSVPVTEYGMKLAGERFRCFKQGWLYAKFYAEKGHIYKKKFEEEES